MPPPQKYIRRTNTSKMNHSLTEASTSAMNHGKQYYRKFTDIGVVYIVKFVFNIILQLSEVKIFDVIDFILSIDLYARTALIPILRIVLNTMHLAGECPKIMEYLLSTEPSISLPKKAISIRKHVIL